MIKRSISKPPSLPRIMSEEGTAPMNGPKIGMILVIPPMTAIRGAYYTPVMSRKM